MESKTSTRNVPISKFQNNVYFEVDKLLFLIFILTFGMHLNLNAQFDKKIDSIQQRINSAENDSIRATEQLTLAEMIIYQDPQKAKAYIDSAETIYQTKTYERGFANLYAVKANYAYTQSDYESAMTYLNRSGDEFMKIGDTLLGLTIKSNVIITMNGLSKPLDSIEKAMNAIEPLIIKYQDSSLMATMLGHRSDMALEKGHRNIALAKMLENIELREAFKDSAYLPQVYYKIGVLYLEMFDYEKGIEQFDIGINICDDVGQNNLKAQLLRMKALGLKQLKRYDESKINYEAALELSKRINLRRNIAKTYIQLAELEMDQGNFTQAKNYLNAYDKLADDIKIGAVLYDYNLTSGQLNLKINQPKAALANLDYCLEVAESYNSFRDISWSKLYRSRALKQLGRLNEAYNELQESSDAKDSLNNYLRTSLSEEQKIIYETNRKEKEIALQKSEIELLREKEKVTKGRQLLLIIGISSLLLLGGLVFYGLRQKMRRQKAEKEKVDASLEFKEKELTTHALHLAHKNEVLLDLKSQLKELKSTSDNSRNYQKVINTINLDINNDNNWEQFRTYFEDVHKGFNAKVMKSYPGVSTNDLRLMSLLKMNLSSKEIANILNISTEGVKKARYRLRKKLNLSTEDSLQELVIEL
ncbi:hypothetical protein [Psychroserpens sp. SPM9]|uniref:tetratricopeptide repeat protein n=1 Tax=Psychroserpens sp. SPM9 TaxID=2975598 RepID=UPI0021A5FD81|nr:hypothetical protein [Psychroserpens sp. SPM9]MDG5492029.1 hypothetical protein [Psychroserpens sp. SPM9]